MKQQIEPVYATFEQSKKLKEKGFNVPCVNYYTPKFTEHGFKTPLRNSELDDFYSAPEQWQIVEWLRINHAIWIQVFPMGEDKEMKFYCKIIKNDNGWVKIVHQISTIVITPQKAYSAAFDHILKELI
jgi:hypothetical protein